MTRLLLRVVVDKVVPQDTCWVLEDTDKCSDLYFLVLNGRPSLAVGSVGTIQLAQVGKPRETPVTLFSYEAVVCVCEGSGSVQRCQTHGLLCGWLDPKD